MREYGYNTNENKQIEERIFHSAVFKRQNNICNLKVRKGKGKFKGNILIT